MKQEREVVLEQKISECHSSSDWSNHTAILAISWWRETFEKKRFATQFPHYAAKFKSGDQIIMSVEAEWQACISIGTKGIQPYQCSSWALGSLGPYLLTRQTNLSVMIYRQFHVCKGWTPPVRFVRVTLHSIAPHLFPLLTTKLFLLPGSSRSAALLLNDAIKIGNADIKLREESYISKTEVILKSITY